MSLCAATVRLIGHVILCGNTSYNIRRQMEGKHGSCRQCGQVLFYGYEAAQDHFPNAKDVRRRGAVVPCTSYFLQEPPHALMERPECSLVEGAESSPPTCGKLKCFKCSSRLGHWNWSGSQCSCGVWVTPAFQITLSKIDLKSAPQENTAFGPN